jgi:membrane associated rhomboid family serine protease
MIPLRDTIPSKTVPILTIFLIIANVLVFMYQVMMTDRQFMSFIHEYGLIPARYANVGMLLQTFNPALYFPFLSNMFLHGSWFHLISNMWILWLFGDNIEDRMGHFQFFIFYILSGVAAGFVHFLFNQTSQIPAVGASGAIAGIMGAYLLLFPYSRIITLIPIFVIVPLFVRIPAVLYLIVWFLSQLYAGAVQMFAGGMVGGVGWWAHIGGFIAGLVFNRFFLKQERYN